MKVGVLKEYRRGEKKRATDLNDSTEKEGREVTVKDLNLLRKKED